MQFTEQHNEIRRTVSRFVEEELNPYVEQWEEAALRAVVVTMYRTT